MGRRLAPFYVETKGEKRKCRVWQLGGLKGEIDRNPSFRKNQNRTMGHPAGLVPIVLSEEDKHCNSIRGKKDRSCGSSLAGDAPHTPGPNPISPDHRCGACDGSWRTCESSQARSGKRHRPVRIPLACADAQPGTN